MCVCVCVCGMLISIKTKAIFHSDNVCLSVSLSLSLSLYIYIYMCVCVCVCACACVVLKSIKTKAVFTEIEMNDKRNVYSSLNCPLLDAYSTEFPIDQSISQNLFILRCSQSLRLIFRFGNKKKSNGLKPREY